jgi:hypothetical protein
VDPRHADEFLNLTHEQKILLRRLTGENVQTDPSELARVEARIKEIEARRYHLSRQWVCGNFDMGA